MRGQGRAKSKAKQLDSVPNMNPSIPDVVNENTGPKKSLGILKKAFAGMADRPKKPVDPAFDIFPEEFESNIENTQDQEISREQDGYKTGVETYLDNRKAKRQKTPTAYNNNYDKIEERVTKFSSPSDEQETTTSTNIDMDGGDEISTSVEYSDPIISTLPTPTSEKMGVPRPGPSTFIQTAKYNPQTKRLNVQYTDGTIFPYQNVSPEMADEILRKKAAHSPGRTMLDTIYYGHGTTKADEISDINEGM